MTSYDRKLQSKGFGLNHRTDLVSYLNLYECHVMQRHNRLIFRETVAQSRSKKYSPQSMEGPLRSD